MADQNPPPSNKGRPMNDGTEQRLLSAIEERFDKFESSQIERFERLERTHTERFERLESNARHLTTEVAAHGKQLYALGEASVSTARAAAAAAEISAQALAKAGSVQDDARKMIESAMAIQKGSISHEVEAAVKPIAAKVDMLETASEQCNEALGAVVEQLGVEDKVSLGREVKPGEAPPQPTLQKIERRARSSTIVQAVIALGMIADVLSRIVWPHH